MTKNAMVIRERGVNLDGERHPKGTVLRLPRNQFDDLEGVGIVRESTDAEVNRESEKRAADKPERRPQTGKPEATPTDDAAPPAAD